MTIVPVNRRAFIKSSAAVTAGLVLSPAIIGRAEAATLKLKCSSSLPNDPKFANGRVYYDNLVKNLKGNGLGEHPGADALALSTNERSEVSGIQQVHRHVTRT